MKSTFFKLFNLLTPAERKRGFLLLGMIIVMAIFDMIGVVSIMPFMAVLSNYDVVESNQYLSLAYKSLNLSSMDEFLFYLGLLVLIALLISISFKALTTYAMLRFSQMRNYAICRRLVEGYLRQPYEWFLSRHSAELGKTILSEVGRVNGMALMPMILLIAHGTVAFGILLLLFFADPFLASSVILCLGTVYIIIYISLRGYLGRIGEDIVKANQGRFHVIHEAFGGIKDVKVSGLEGVFLHRFDDPAKQFAKCQAASQVASQLPRFALEIAAFGGMLLVVLYLMRSPGGLQEALPLLSLYAFAGYRLMPALQNVYVQISTLRFAQPALDALYKDLEQLEPDNSVNLYKARIKPMKVLRDIKLTSIKYNYSGTEKTVLDNLDIEIKTHTTVGIVGTTGSGKTTTVDLLLGLLRPKSGQLCVDDVPITHDNVRAWQNNIGYVPQAIYLSDDSVAANIAFGIPKDEINFEAVEQAARIANLHDFVIKDMPDGYETLVGERGIRLSGGQRQRIGIARALYHDPEVLILDEATSALDNLTEQAVMEAVHNLGHRKTIILIAHRLTTIRECDMIFLLDQGCVADNGTFDELVEKSSYFHSMVNGNL